MVAAHVLREMRDRTREHKYQSAKYAGSSTYACFVEAVTHGIYGRGEPFVFLKCVHLKELYIPHPITDFAVKQKWLRVAAEQPDGPSTQRKYFAPQE